MRNTRIWCNWFLRDVSLSCLSSKKYPVWVRLRLIILARNSIYDFSIICMKIWCFVHNIRIIMFDRQCSRATSATFKPIKTVNWFLMLRSSCNKSITHSLFAAYKWVWLCYLCWHNLTRCVPDLQLTTAWPSSHDPKHVSRCRNSFSDLWSSLVLPSWNGKHIAYSIM